MKKIIFLILCITLTITVVMSDAAAREKKGPKIRLGEFTGTDSGSGTAADKTDSSSPKGLTDDDVEFMYRAGVFDDEEPLGFFRQRISIGYNLFMISRHFIYEYDGGGLLVEREMERAYSHGIAIQYHLGISLMRDYDWRGNPILGVNFLLDGSFGYGENNIMTLGLGGEVHFLWIFKIAAGVGYIKSESTIFRSGEYAPFYGQNKPVRNEKSGILPFIQFGISIPVSNKYDVFALFSEFRNEEGQGGDRPFPDIEFFRAGISWKF